MRLNTGGSEEIENAPYTISKISSRGVSHIRVYPMVDKSGFRCKIRVNGEMTTLKSVGTIVELVNAGLALYPSIFSAICSGHPFAEIFVEYGANIGNYESANNDADEPESEDEELSDSASRRATRNLTMRMVSQSASI